MGRPGARLGILLLVAILGCGDASALRMGAHEQAHRERSRVSAAASEALTEGPTLGASTLPRRYSVESTRPPGFGSLAGSVESIQLNAPGQIRLAGADRYKTAEQISRHTHPSPASTVFIAVGTNFPDAIAGGPAAAVLDAPILLVLRTKIPSATQRELRRLDPTRVVILGGTGAVSAQVEAEISGIVPTAKIDRIAGRHRYDTAVGVSRIGFPDGSETVYVAPGDSFVEALAAAPAAIAEGGSLLLVRSSMIHGSVRAELSRLAPSKIVVVGDTSAISESVFGELAGYADSIERIADTGGQATSAAVSSAAFADGADTVYVAVGDKYPDALTGGPATAVSPGPLLLVNRNSVPRAVASEVARLRPSLIVIFGGAGAVSDPVVALLVGLAGGGVAPPPASAGIRLTFDDGPHPTWTPRVLDILDAHGVKATFFATGWKVDKYPELALEIIRRGHSLQTHSYNHPNFYGWSYGGISNEISAGVDAIERATGTRPSCVRPPFGVVTANVRAVAEDLGLEILNWDADSRDYSHQSASGILNASRTWEGWEVVLGHDTLGYLWDDVLDQIIEEHHALGHHFSSVCSNL